MKRITILQALITALKLYVSGEILSRAIRTSFEFRSLVNEALELGLSKEDILRMMW